MVISFWSSCNLPKVCPPPLRRSRCHQLQENSFIWALGTPLSMYIYCLHLHTLLFTVAPIITCIMFICLVTDAFPLLMTLSWFGFCWHLSLALFHFFFFFPREEEQQSTLLPICYFLLCWVFLTCIFRGRKLNSDWFNVIFFSNTGYLMRGI